MILRSTLLTVVAIAVLITSAEAVPRPPKANSQQGTVLKLYRDFAWEAVMDVPGWDGLMDQPRKVLDQYFDEKLTSLILRDRACAEKKGMCRLDFCPIWASQDPSAGDLQVEPSDKPNYVSVKFRYPSTNEKVELKYRLTQTPKGWRISDIIGPDWSLLNILTAPSE